MANGDSDMKQANFGQTAANKDFNRQIKVHTNFDLSGGVSSQVLDSSKFAAGFDLFEDKDKIEVDFLLLLAVLTGIPTQPLLMI